MAVFMFAGSFTHVVQRNAPTISFTTSRTFRSLSSKRRTTTTRLAQAFIRRLGYAQTLDIPFVFSSNGDGFLFHDKTVTAGTIETEVSLANFPSPEILWKKYKAFKGITEEAEPVVAQDYYIDATGRSPRYYQQIAINRTVEAIAENAGNNRHLLVMATGTDKTYVAFQIIYRLWKSRAKKRILFLADRTALIDQTVRGDFRHFKEAMTVDQKEANGYRVQCLPRALPRAV